MVRDGLVPVADEAVGAATVDDGDDGAAVSVSPQAAASTSITPRTGLQPRSIPGRYRWFARMKVMADPPECHKVEWARLKIGERSWRVKLEYG
jgi:hypothetical protein